jgi:hypothetical protein
MEEWKSTFQFQWETISVVHLLKLLGLQSFIQMYSFQNTKPELLSLNPAACLDRYEIPEHVIWCCVMKAIVHLKGVVIDEYRRTVEYYQGKIIKTLGGGTY